MRGLLTVIATLTVLWCSAATGHAQLTLSVADVSSFQGTWLLDLSRSALSEADSERRVITTDATSMRIDVYRVQDAHPFTLIYQFDGSATVTPFGEGTAVSKLRREPQGLVTETVYAVKAQPITVQEFLPLGPDGAELTIQVVLRVEHGYQGVRTPLDRAPPNVAKATKVFLKQP